MKAYAEIIFCWINYAIIEVRIWSCKGGENLMALWIAIGAAIICAGIAIYYGTKRKK